MGWRGALRSVVAAERREERERQRRRNAAQRLLNKLDRSAAQAMEKANRLEAHLHKDIIKALNLQYNSHRGFQSDPFVIDAGFINGSFSLTPNNSREDRFSPPAYEVEDVRVEALDLLLTPWATVVAIQIESSAPDLRVKLNWVKKINRAESKIVLIDKVRGHYYYPIATDLAGEVLPGVPKTGLVAFEPFRETTPEFQIRIAGARFRADKFEPELVYNYSSTNLAAAISDNLSKPPLSDQIKTIVETEVATQFKKPGAAGCLGILALSAVVLFLWFGGPGATNDTTQQIHSSQVKSAPTPISASTTKTYTSDKDAQKDAVALYPELGVPNSKFNQRFNELCRAYKASRLEFFNSPDWPLRLAAEVASFNPK
jgi:hypothetical protein